MKYTEKQRTEIINKICERISQGEALRNICNEDDTIDIVTFYNWVDNDAARVKQYTHARAERAVNIFEDIIDIVDEDCDYTIVDEGGNTITRVDSAKVNHQRLKHDARKWILGKMDSDKYGDKVINENLNKNVDLPATKEECDAQLEELKKKAAEDDV